MMAGTVACADESNVELTNTAETTTVDENNSNEISPSKMKEMMSEKKEVKTTTTKVTTKKQTQLKLQLLQPKPPQVKRQLLLFR